MCCPLRAVMGRRPITVREPRGKMTCSPHFVWFADDVALSRDIEAIPAPIAGLDPSRNREPAANEITGKPHWAEAELGEQLYAGGKSRREDQMTGRRFKIRIGAVASSASDIDDDDPPVLGCVRISGIGRIGRPFPHNL